MHGISKNVVFSSNLIKYGFFSESNDEFPLNFIDAFLLTLTFPLSTIIVFVFTLVSLSLPWGNSEFSELIIKSGRFVGW